MQWNRKCLLHISRIRNNRDFHGQTSSLREGAPAMFTALKHKMSHQDLTISMRSNSIVHLMFTATLWVIVSLNCIANCIIQTQTSTIQKPTTIDIFPIFGVHLVWTQRKSRFFSLFTCVKKTNPKSKRWDQSNQKHETIHHQSIKLVKQRH